MCFSNVKKRKKKNVDSSRRRLLITAYRNEQNYHVVGVGLAAVLHQDNKAADPITWEASVSRATERQQICSPDEILCAFTLLRCTLSTHWSFPSVLQQRVWGMSQLCSTSRFPLLTHTPYITAHPEDHLPSTEHFPNPLPHHMPRPTQTNNPSTLIQWQQPYLFTIDVRQTVRLLDPGRVMYCRSH